MANKPSEFPIFTPVDNRTLVQMGNKIITYLERLSGFLSIKTIDITKSNELLKDVIEHVEKRRIRHHIFRNGDAMDELSEGALLCYWVAKLHPFHHHKINSKLLNAKIALCLFTGVILYYCLQNSRVSRLSGNLINELYYSLKHEDISEDAIILLAKSLVN